MYDPTGVGRELRSRVASLASREASDVAYMETVCTQFLCTTTSHPCTWIMIPRKPSLHSIFTYLRLAYPSVRSRLQGMQNDLSITLTGRSFVRNLVIYLSFTLSWSVACLSIVA